MSFVAKPGTRKFYNMAFTFGKTAVRMERAVAVATAALDFVVVVIGDPLSVSKVIQN